MTHIASNETNIDEVSRLARVLEISEAEAGETLGAFTRVFSNVAVGRQIFEMMREVDVAAEAGGEPGTLVISYEVEVTRGGSIKVGRWTHEVPEGEVWPEQIPNRAPVFLRVSGMPRGEWLGPLVLQRPEPQIESNAQELSIRERYPEFEWDKCEIYDIEPRWSFPDRFPFLVGLIITAKTAADLRVSTAASPLTATQRSGASGSSSCAVGASPSGRPLSGLSPPAAVGDRGHSGRKLSRRQLTQQTKRH